MIQNPSFEDYGSIAGSNWLKVFTIPGWVAGPSYTEAVGDTATSTADGKFVMHLNGGGTVSGPSGITQKLNRLLVFLAAYSLIF